MISRVVLTSFTRMVLLAASLMAMTAGAAMAQTTTGNIRGYVRGPGNLPMEGAIVAARHTEMNTTRGTNTNAAGFYNLAGLRPGPYELTVRRLGAAQQTRTIRVQIGQTLDIDFELSETAVTLTAVQVTADLVQRETRTSEVASNVTQEQIEDLPSRDRNFLDLTKLAPGVNQAPVNNTDKKFSAGAQPADFINVFVDGASYKNDVLQGGVAGQDASRGNPFPQGAVQEFRVITQNFKAEYQKAASAIITATTKSGGNTWEGDAFFNTIGRGSKFTARDPISVRDNRPRPDFSRIQAGGSVGGPLARDRMFFFGTYEINFENSPGDVFVGGDSAFAPPGLNPRQFEGRFTQEFRQHLGFGKLTFTPSDRNTFDVSANIRRESDIAGFGGQTSFESAEDKQQQVYTGVANWRYSGDRWLNEAQISGQHYRWNPQPLDEGEIGRNYFGIIRIGGRDTEQRFTQNRISLRNDVTRSAVQWAGDHVFKGGVSVDFLTYEATKFFTGNPVFNFRRDENYLRPFEVFFGFGQPTQKANNTQFGAYIQDDWAIGDRLVLNLGLRWDVETNMINNDHVTPSQIRDSLSTVFRDSLFVTVPQQTGPSRVVRTVDQLGGLGRYFTDGDDRPAFKKAFQPRLGASFDVFGDGRTVVFGGFGVYYDRNFWNQMFDEEFRRDYKVLQILFDTIGPRPGCTFCVEWDPKYFNKDTLAALAASGRAGAPEVFLIANDTKPPKTNQFSLGMRQMLGNTLVSLTYAGARSVNGFAFIRGTRRDDGGRDASVLAPSYTRLLISDDRVKTWYDAILLGIDKPLRMDSRWGGGVSYTWAFNNDRQGNFFFSLDPRYPTVADFPRVRAPETQEHTVVANGIARIPWGFLLSSVVTLGTGFTQQADDETFGTGDAFRTRYIFEPPTRSFLGVGSVFATQNMDLRLAKDFAVTGGQRAGLAIDLFNVFNSRNFGCYDARIPPTGQTNSAFGRPGCSAPGRRLQIGLTYDFGPSIAGTGGR